MCHVRANKMTICVTVNKKIYIYIYKIYKTEKKKEKKKEHSGHQN